MALGSNLNSDQFTKDSFNLGLDGIPTNKLNDGPCFPNNNNNNNLLKTGVVQDKDFNIVRYRLDQLDYKEWLDPVSTPLVKRLLQDLVQTTQSAREWKSTGSGMHEEIRLIQEQVAPLRKELAGLEMENGMLHREIIELQDGKDIMSKHHQAQLRKSEKELQELRFMNAQLNTEVSRERDRTRAAFLKVEDLSEKIGIIGSVNEGVTLKNQEKAVRAKLFERVQKIDIETGLAPMDIDKPFPPLDPTYVDLVTLAQDQLEKEKISAQEERSKALAAQDEIQIALDQIGKRDREITRLASQLELVRSNQFTTGRIAAETDITTSAVGINDLNAAHQRIQHLELQLESLHTHIETLETEIGQMEGQKISVLTRITDEKKKVELDLDVEKKKNTTLMKTVGRMEVVVAEMEGLRNRDVEKGSDRASSANSGIIKPSTAVKNAKLVKELELKLNAMALKNEQSKKRLEMMRKDFAKTQKENEKLRKELDNVLLGQSKSSADLKKPSNNKSNLLPQASIAVGTSMTSLNANYTLSTHQIDEKLQETIRERIALQQQVKTLNSTLGQTKSNLDTTTELLKSVRSSLTLQGHDLSQSQANYKMAKAERDAFECAINDIEGNVGEVVEKLESVVRERDTAREMYKQVHEELERLRRGASGRSVDAVPCLKTVSSVAADPLEVDSLKSKIADLTVEKEKLSQLVNEKEGQVLLLKDDMRALVLRQRENGSLADEAVTLLEKELTEGQQAFSNIQKERDAALAQLEIFREEIKSMEKLKITLVHESENDLKRTTKMELELEKVKLELRTANKSKQQLQEKADELLAQLDGDKAKIRDLERVIGEHKHLLDEIDRERDGFQRDLDYKTEKILEFQDRNQSLEQRVSASEKKATSLQDQVESMTKHLNNTDRQCATLTRQLQDASSASKHWQDQAQQYHVEGQRITSDLVALTKENQILSNEMGETSRARDRYQGELVECESQLATLNELVDAKDQEKQEVLYNYRKVIVEHERLDLAYRSNMEEANNLKMELVSREKKIDKLEKEIDSISRSANQLQIDSHANSKQHSQLSRALVTSERQIKQLETDKLRLIREAQAARDAVQSIDRNQDSLSRGYAVLTLDHEKLVTKLKKMEQESGALEMQLKNEILKGKQLESILNEERTQKIQTERSEQDLKILQSQTEYRSKAVVDQQEVRLLEKIGQLEESRSALANSGIRITYLEKLLLEKDSEIKACNQELEQVRKKLEATSQENQKLGESVLKLIDLNNQSSTPSKTGADSHIMSALASIQRERQSTSAQLETTLALAPSSPATEKVETERARFETNVLDAIVKESNNSK